MIVDTGTTLHYLDTWAWVSIAMDIMTKVPWAGEGFLDMQVCAKENQLHLFPDVIIKVATTSMAGAPTFDVILKPKQYLFDVEGCYYMGIIPTDGLSIFGNIGMKQRTLVFDVENDRVGFARGTCPGSWPYTPSAWQLQMAKDRKHIPNWRPRAHSQGPYDPADRSNAGRV